MKSTATTSEIACCYPRCGELWRYVAIVFPDAGEPSTIHSWPVCRGHRFYLAEYLTTRRGYQEMLTELKERGLPAPLPERFDVDFRRFR